MTKLSDIQLILLSNAAARSDGSLLPPPVNVAGQMARIRKAIPPLIKRELVVEIDVTVDDHIWQQDGDRKIGLAITEAGRQTIGVESRDADKSGTAAKQPTTPPSAARVTKIDTVLNMLRRSDGATLTELVDATGWLPHTTRAALTGLRKKGHDIAKGKRGDTTSYSIKAAA
jgi:hypothetical protein